MNNRRTMPVHLADHLALGPHIPGIFVIGENMGMGAIIDELFLIAHDYTSRPPAPWLPCSDE